MRRAYSRDTVKGWFRVFHTMMRDAMAALHLRIGPGDESGTLAVPLHVEAARRYFSNAGPLDYAPAR